jgi:hypothetical protein
VIFLKKKFSDTKENLFLSVPAWKEQSFFKYGEALFQNFLEGVSINGFASRCNILPAVNH